MTIAEAVSEFVANNAYENIPHEVLDGAKRCILDTLGCMLLGTRSKWADVLGRSLNSWGGERQAGIVGLSIVTSAPWAAFGNGVLSHVDDLDDVFWTLGHPSAVVLPAVLALSEMKNRSGKDFLTAFVSGWEVACHLSGFFFPRHIQTGWHSTATLGIFGAASGASKTLGLNSERTCWALGLAACQSAGLRADFGTMAKAFHIGKVAMNGVMAGLLAEGGVNSAKDTFENRHGFLKAYNAPFYENAEEISEGLGAPWKILNPGPLFKIYPTCTGTHPGIEAILELRKSAFFQPEDVVSVTVFTDPGGPDMLTFDRP